jgi:hypothetical protein
MNRNWLFFAAFSDKRVAPGYTGKENPGGTWSDVEQRYHELDPGIGEVVRALNEMGYKTLGSCSGLECDHAGRESDMVEPHGGEKRYSVYSPMVVIEVQAGQQEKVLAAAQKSGLEVSFLAANLVQVALDNLADLEAWKAGQRSSRWIEPGRVKVAWDKFIQELARMQVPSWYVSPS